jgi:YD repeat-containing protein
MRKTILAISIVIILINPAIIAQNSGPAAPEAMSFEPVDATDMVNLLTGDFTYVMPLITVPSPEGGYPIALNYHGGISMDQEASWVGLGWNINPGAINRSMQGFPDDWKGKEIHSFYHNGGESETTHTISVSYTTPGAVSVGVTYSWGSYQGFGGSVGFAFANELLNAGLSVDAQGNVGLSLGIEINKYIKVDKETQKAAGLSSSINVNINSSTGDVSASPSVGMSSMGYRLSGNGSSLSIGASGKGSFSVGVGSMSISQNDVSISVSSFGIYIPIPLPTIGILTLGYRRTDTKWWIDQLRETTVGGTIYLEEGRMLDMHDDIQEEFQSPEYTMDVYMNNFDFHSFNNNILNQGSNCFMYPAFDQFGVSAQGIGGVLEQGIYENAELVKNSGKWNERAGTFFVSTGKNFTDNIDNVYYYLKNEPTSYLEVTSGVFSATDTDPFNYIFSGGDINYPSAQYPDAYNSTTKRKSSGNYVEWYTNSQIANNETNFFIETESITESRLDNEFFDPDGIGGFTITTSDGKTYHYSLPVYQFEKFKYDLDITDMEEPDDDKLAMIAYLESRFGISYEQKEIRSYDFWPEKYATTWLLTAVTGPDYIDDGDGYLNESDYGYWVKFDYGKWTDGFIWRTPYEGFNRYVGNNRVHDTYEWGRKQIYYLDKIQTRTHTAYFVKDIRTDGLGATLSFSEDRKETGGAVKVRTDKLFNCATEEQVNVDRKYVDAEKYHQIDISVPEKHKILRLSKIILVANKDATLTEFNTYPFMQIPHREMGQLDYSQIYNTTFYNPDIIGTYCQKLISSGTAKIYQQNNVLDIGDLTNSNIEAKAIKTIVFEYDDNPLCQETPNAEGPLKGKLTLQRVKILGQSGADYLPAYEFKYNRFHRVYYKGRMDNWGYDGGLLTSPIISDQKLNVANWSLNEIITPTGASIKINYESDTYYNEALKVFTKRIDVIDMEVVNGSRVVLNMAEDPIAFGLTLGEHRLHHDELDIRGVITAISGTLITFETTDYALPGFPHDIVFESKIDKKDTYFLIPTTIPDDTYFGGGVRVTEINLDDNEGNTITTRYSYLDPNTGITSGITSYAPIYDPRTPEVENFDYIPYLPEIPSPKVTYKFVTVENVSSANDVDTKTLYEFEVLSPIAYTNDHNYRVGNLFQVIEATTSLGHLSHEFELFHFPFNVTSTMNAYGEAIAKHIVLEDNFNNIGRLISQKELNAFDDLITNTEYDYFENYELSQGIDQQTFSHVKVSWNKDNSDNKRYNWFLNASSKRTYPNVVKSITTVGQDRTSTVYNEEFDFYTGLVTQSRTVNSFGDEIITNTLPAYHINEYSGMGLKAHDIDNTNMLTQSAATITTKNSKVIETDIQTWKGDWNNYMEWNNTLGAMEATGDDSKPIWRKHKVFAWDGGIEEDGTYSDDFDTYADISYLRDNWNTLFGGDGVDKWEKISEIVRYDHFSTPVEVTDINGDYAATKKDPAGTYTISTAANARHSQFAHCSFEYAPYTNNEGESGVYINNPSNVVINEEGIFAHTGTGSLEASSGQTVVEYNIPLSEINSWSNTYPLYFYSSVWVYDPQEEFGSNVDCQITGPVSPSNIKTFRTGDWVQLSCMFELGSTPTDLISFSVVNSGSSTTYFDDFRVNPYQAAVMAYTYNNAGLVTSIINNDNFATKYAYDEIGRLKATYVEKPTGFAKTSSHEYNYALDETLFYHVTIVENDHGTLENCPSTVSPGDDFTFTIVPDEDYDVTEVIIDGNTFGKLVNYTVRNVQDHVDISVKYIRLHEIRVRIFDGENPPTGMLTDAGLELTIVEEGLSLPLVDGEFRDNFAEGWAGTLQPSLAGYYFEPATYVIDNLQQREIISFTGYEIGTITGSASANAFSTGTYTIPANAHRYYMVGTQWGQHC